MILEIIAVDKYCSLTLCLRACATSRRAAKFLPEELIKESSIGMPETER